jgi:hypothetical protein
VHDYLSYFRIMWAYTLVPAVAGVSIPPSALNAVQIAGVIAGQLIVIALLALSLRYKRAAWRAWLFVGIVVFTTGVLVARQRVPLFGPGIGGDLRYLVDFAWLIPVTFCFVFSRNKVLVPVRPSETTIGAIQLPRRRLGLAVALLVVVCGAVAVATASRLERAWPALQARHWDQHLRRGLASVARGHGRPVIADAEAPFEIVSDWEDPYSRLSRVLPLYNGSIQVDGPLDGPLFTIDAAGNVQRAEMVTLARLPIRTGCHAERDYHVALAASGAPYYIVVSYVARHPIRLPLFVDPGRGYAQSPVSELELGPSAESAIAWLRYATVRGIRVAPPPAASACIRGIDLVSLRSTAQR